MVRRTTGRSQKELGGHKAPSFIYATRYMLFGVYFVGICAVIGAGALKVLVPKGLAEKWNDSVIEAIYCIVLLILCLASIASNTYNPFIYFQF